MQVREFALSKCGNFTIKLFYIDEPGKAKDSFKKIMFTKRVDFSIRYNFTFKWKLHTVYVE